MGYRSGTDTTEQYHSVDIRKIRIKRLLQTGGQLTLRWSRCGSPTGALVGQAEQGSMRFLYGCRSRCDDEWNSREFVIRLAWTPCNFGGYRPWFICPAQGCGHRVAVLYGGRGIFACRHCYQLVYESQREQPHDRALRRVQAIRMKLGGSGSMAEPFPGKPKGMHRRTYQRLCLEAASMAPLLWPPWLLRRIGRDNS